MPNNSATAEPFPTKLWPCEGGVQGPPHPREAQPSKAKGGGFALNRPAAQPSSGQSFPPSGGNWGTVWLLLDPLGHWKDLREAPSRSTSRAFDARGGNGCPPASDGGRPGNKPKSAKGAAPPSSVRSARSITIGLARHADPAGPRVQLRRESVSPPIGQATTAPRSPRVRASVWLIWRMLAEIELAERRARRASQQTPRQSSGDVGRVRPALGQPPAHRACAKFRDKARLVPGPRCALAIIYLTKQP